MGGSRRVVVLVVDDEPMVRNMVCALLERQGYAVLSANDGEEALTLSREYAGSIEMLLTDYRMPGITGLQLAEAVRRERPGIKVLLMSGKLSDSLHERGLPVPFLEKPFPAAVLWRKIAEVLKGADAGPQEI